MTIGLRRTTAAAALAAMVLLAAPAATAHALPGPGTAPAPTTAATATALELPRPTGPHAVGTEVLHLVDHSRTDPWVPTAGARELMVSLHYPARPGSGGARAPYMSTEEARLMLVQRGLEDIVPATALSSTLTHARPAARPAPGRFPLVLLSPGFGQPRATLTSLAEDLASRGYVVASVDHAYESSGTSLPDGRVLTCAACDADNAAPDEAAARAVRKKVSTGRAADLAFVLDRLTGPRPAWDHARTIDRRRVAAAGHSIGGSAAASTMLADPRVDAGVNMDGTFFEEIPATGLGKRPFMMLGTQAGHSPGTLDTSWNDGWKRLDGWKRWLTVRDSGHFTFTDTPYLAEQAGLPVDPTAPLSGTRSTQITRTYVAAFLDQHLKGAAQPLLDGPAPDNPEVVFNTP
ncbi:alpha/beta hydrolase [Streptomyces sp. NBC_00059]|uniref:alpha/beta hydrolase family protein n=1 Tax=Streptomyces sp. NBC_00059 TaxID=2975635 RepID=UPI00224EE88D|nr:alpha/beta hydrolase [Streptomyces sp. NBC_00059]MCX5411892.1 alpha/beta hydrolase [Streptomyces sp. NBC_00059]